MKLCLHLKSTKLSDLQFQNVEQGYPSNQSVKFINANIFLVVFSMFFDFIIAQNVPSTVFLYTLYSVTPFCPFLQIFALCFTPPYPNISKET